MQNNHSRPPLKDRIIPYYFVAAFLVVFAVNGVFVWLATSHHSGVVTEQAYEKGLHYNEVIASAKAQAALGWNVQITYEQDVLEVSLRDSHGQFLQDASVEATFRRPVEHGYDSTLPLTETQAGHYQASTQLPLKGVWDVTVSILWKQQEYQQRKRLVVR